VATHPRIFFKISQVISARVNRSYYFLPALQVKDYYSILEIKPGAGGDEIKKAFRRLAHQFHPDKSNGDLYAKARFTQIKEAYEVLSNPVRKEHYLQQRWYAQSAGKRIKHETTTPVNVLKQVLELDRYVSRLDMHRMDHRGLFDYMQNVLSDATVETLNAFNDPDINKDIILISLQCARVLPYQMMLQITGRLQKLKHHEPTAEKIEHFLRHSARVHNWEKKQLWIVIAIVLSICLGIFLVSR